MSTDLPILLPPPRRIAVLDGFLADEGAADRVRTRVDPSSGLPAEGYRLRIGADGIEIEAADPAGAFYAGRTLAQLERQRDRARGLRCLEIEDAPAMPHRGVMLDVSRDRVPTMETLYGLVDLLAEWKVNELQLYMEHTFAYSRHREVWENASPFTPEEIRSLDAYCRDRFVELVPNQNSLGHMERWLRLPRYRDLAEAPDGFDYPWGGRSDGPHSLNPTDPRSLDLLRELYDELLPNFTSERFNVGLDETWDVGQGRSRAACEAAGAGRVYLEFLRKVHREVELRGRSMMFWGDVILNHPELIAELPPRITALEWGYEADHPFDADGARFAAARVPFYVCPGTSTWNAIAGRADNAVANIRSAARAALRHGAVGLLVTDWGDNGHWQPPPVSWLGFAQAAASAWAGTDGEEGWDLRAALDLHAFRDEAGVMAGVAFDLGNAYQDTGVLLKNATVLARLLLFPQRPMSHPDFARLTVEGLQRAEARIEGALSRIPSSRMARPDAELVAEEFNLVGAMLVLACRIGRARLDASASSFAEELAGTAQAFRRLWLRRSRAGGLAESVGRLGTR